MKKFLKWAGMAMGALVVSGAGMYGVASYVTQRALDKKFPVPTIGIDNAVASADIKLGERIVRVRNGCVDCHGEDLGGKVVIDDPAMGRFYARNLTPKNLREWTNDEIAAAIRYGLGRTRKPLIFMPSMEYHLLSESDLAAVIAYLRSVPSVEREDQETIVGPLAKVLFSLGKLPMLASSHIIDFQAPMNQKPEEAPTMEFGSYLANSACMGCHGPQFAGGPIPGAPPEWPPASDIRLGQNKIWTEESFISAMRTGVSPRTSQPIRPPMPIALTKQMNDMELKALWLFLSSAN